MSKTHMVQYKTRAQRASIQADSPKSEERDRKRSAPVQSTAFVVDEKPKTRKVSSRRSSGGSTSQKVQPKAQPLGGGGGGYLNRGFGGSVNSVPSVSDIAESHTTVIHEQYCACARWSRVQQLLLVAVGVLTGIVAGLVILVLLLAATDEDVLDNLLRHAPSTVPPAVDSSGVSS